MGRITALDKLPPASFSGIKFPYARRRIRGAERHYVHKYPHAAGGAPEKLGRDLYQVTFEANFQDRFPKYPNLYPIALDQLRVLFESGTTDTLVVPGMAAIQAFCVNWDRDLNVRIRSGELVELVFLEDQSSAFAVAALVNLASPQVDTQAARMAAELASIKAQLSVAQAAHLSSLMDGIQDAVNAITAVQSQADAQAAYISARCQQVQSMCQQLDAADPFKQPKNAALIDSMHDVWASANALAQDLANHNLTLQTFVTPMLMSASQVSSAIYGGDATKATQLVALNSITDPSTIPANTPIVYYPLAA